MFSVIYGGAITTVYTVYIFILVILLCTFYSHFVLTLIELCFILFMKISVGFFMEVTKCRKELRS